MNRNIESLAVINKNLTSKRVLKSTQTTFEVYRPEYFSFTKAVDRPDDYYFEGDLITYILKLKNVGIKNLVNFTLRDDAPSNIDPLESGYFEVITTQGAISFDDKNINISNINLAPGEELEITITGLVRQTPYKEDKKEELAF